MRPPGARVGRLPGLCERARPVSWYSVRGAGTSYCASPVRSRMARRACQGIPVREEGQRQGGVASVWTLPSAKRPGYGAMFGVCSRLPPPWGTRERRPTIDEGSRGYCLSRHHVRVGRPVGWILGMLPDNVLAVRGDASHLRDSFTTAWFGRRVEKRQGRFLQPGRGYSPGVPVAARARLQTLGKDRGSLLAHGHGHWGVLRGLPPAECSGSARSRRKDEREPRCSP